MKLILILLAALIISSESLADDYRSRGSIYYESTYYDRYLPRGSARSEYPGCNTCSLPSIQGNSMAERILRNDMWRLETGNMYNDYDRGRRY